MRSTLRRAIAVSSSSAASLAGSSSRSAGSITRSAPASSVSSCSSGVVNAACAGPRRPSTRISRIPEPRIAAIASSVVSVGSISSAVSASIRATSTATFPLPTTTARSAERSNGTILEVRVAVVPGDERRRRPRAGQILAGDVHPPVGLRAEGVDDRVVQLRQLVVGEVAADLDVAEEAEAGALRDPLERARDGLDLGVVGRDAEPDEAPRRRQPVEHVHLDGRLLAREQRSRRVEPRRPRADNRHAKGVLGGHASRIMARGCGEPRRNRGSERDEACLRGRRRDRRRRARRGRRRLGRLGLVGEPAARDLQRDGLRDPGRRRRAGDGHGDGGHARDLGHRPARAGRRADAAVHADGRARRGAPRVGPHGRRRSRSTAPCRGPSCASTRATSSR